jgi:TRAP-type C4-dicarboxylate transport system substrate-binding protein
MTITRRTWLGLSGALALTLGAHGAAAQEVTLRMHQFLPAQANVPALILVPWAEKVMAESDGRIEIQHFPAMQLGGKPPELVDQVIDGVADIVWTVPGYTPGRFARTEVFELPFIMSEAEATSKAYWELAEETMMDQDFKDMKILAVWVHGPGLIHSAEPVESLADMEGLKVRGPTRIITKLLENLGATPVGMPVPAVPEALSKGVIEATVIPWEVTPALKVSELVHNHTEFGDAALYTTTFILAMNKEKYDSLPDDLKAVIDANSGIETSGWAGKTMQGADGPSREIALDLGNTIIELSPEQVAEWQAAAQPTIDAWVAEMDENGMDGTGLYARAQELIAAHSGD